MRKISCLLAMTLLSAPLPAQTVKHDASNLSNGFRYGMLPDEVAVVARSIPGISKAQVGGSASKPVVKLGYRTPDISELGFHFRFAFSFYEGRLIWVDLVGTGECSSKLERTIEDMRDKLDGLYGSSDASGVYRVRSTSVYLISSDDSPRLIGTEPSTGYQLRKYDMKRQCGDESLGHLVVRFKGDAPSLDRVVTEAEAQASRQALKAEAEKNHADKASLGLAD